MPAGARRSVASTLRVAHGAVPLLVLLAAGCADETTTSAGSIQPGVVTWMEWPAGVTAAAAGRIRVIGPDNFCGTLTFAVSTGPQRLSVVPAFRYDPPCLAVPGVATSYDTLLPLPVLDAGQGLPASSRVVAPGYDYPYSDLVTRGFGLVRRDSAPDTARVAGGEAVLLADSLGCGWARVAAFGPHPPVYVVENPPDLGPAGTQVAFVSGHFVPAVPARCGQADVLHLDSAQIAAALP